MYVFATALFWIFFFISAHRRYCIWDICTCDYVNFLSFLTILLSLLFLLLLSLFVENEVSWVESLINKENT
jgi:hypothetical protein